MQAAILNLLAELQSELHNALLFISHDIAVVGYLADQITVMYLGQVMQFSPTEKIFDPPYHPYTEALLSSVPPPDPFVAQERIRLEGELPRARLTRRPAAHSIHAARVYLGDICVEQTPPWRETEDGKRIFCRIPLDELKRTQQPVLRFGANPKRFDMAISVCGAWGSWSLRY